MAAAAAHLGAQATRTWVSGVGDDANPCSRTAPCKTFAGAISKTAANGEINALDPGGYGAVTITKSITIVGTGTMASTLISGTNGIVVAAGASDIVTLRNLEIDALRSGDTTDAVKFLSGKQLTIDNCDIYGAPRRGISIESSTDGAQVFIANTQVRDGLKSGIGVTPVGVTNNVVLDNVRSTGNGGWGVWVSTGAKTEIRNSVISNNGFGLHVDTGMASMESTLISGSATGLELRSGAQMTLLNSTIVRNALGIDSSGASVYSFGNNQIFANTSGNILTATLLSQQ